MNRRYFAGSEDDQAASVDRILRTVFRDHQPEFANPLASTRWLSHEHDCVKCHQQWPCDTVTLAFEVNNLRADRLDLSAVEGRLAAIEAFLSRPFKETP